MRGALTMRPLLQPPNTPATPLPNSRGWDSEIVNSDTGRQPRGAALPCGVNYRGYAVAVHRRLCYPHVTAAAVYNKYIRGPGLLDERAEDLPH